MKSSPTYLWFNKHQINKQHYKVVLDILVREALATGTLHQPHVSTPSSTFGLAPSLGDFWYIGSGLGGGCDFGTGLFVGWIRDEWSGGFVVSAMEDVIKLRDWVATFDTYWHNALESVCHMIIFVFCSSVDSLETIEYSMSVKIYRVSRAATLRRSSCVLIRIVAVV